MNSKGKLKYIKPNLIKYDSVKSLTKAWNTGSEDGDSGVYQP